MAILAMGSAGSSASQPTFEDFLQGVANCALDLSRFGSYPVNSDGEAVLLALPASGSVGGILVSSFYFSPPNVGKTEAYGLVFNAPVEAVIKAVPDLALKKNINGYLRRLIRLSEETADEKARRATLLICTGGMDV